VLALKVLRDELDLTTEPALLRLCGVDGVHPLVLDELIRSRPGPLLRSRCIALL